MLRILSAYGRAARMRSCALRIFDAATISMALVIFLVFSTDLILPRISLPTAMTVAPSWRLGERLLEGGDRVDQLRFAVLVQRLVAFQLLQQRGMAGLQELVQAVLEGQ